MIEAFKNNRKNIFENISQDNFALVLFSGTPPIKQGDQKYPFTPNRNFFYLTGINKPNFIFLGYKNEKETNEIIFIERQDELKAKWDGKLLSKEDVKQISGIENIKYLDEFEETFSNIIFKNHIENLFLDLENRYFKTTSLSIDFSEKIQKLYPYIKIINVYENFANLRVIKKAYEIENIKKAIDITKSGIYSVMKNCKPKMLEYEIEAYYDFELKKYGVKEKAFETILASGENATVLHYGDNNCEVQENDLILLDLGATYENYSADITRTFPVSKKFTKRQKQFYNIVLEAQQLVIENVKPEVKFSYLQELVKNYYFEKLSEIGLVSKKEDVDKYYYHNIGHMLGLETHDVMPKNCGTLKEGMVITVEPGLYIKEEKIGIRIEDDVLVTKNGSEVLSKDIIKTVEDIENFMKDN